MATYKVPQDVEADDKLIGPFSFRQFIYLIIVALAGAAAWGLAQLFVGLAIIPLPIILFFGALALPLRKDQPMEVYLAAIVSYYLKPRKRMWDPDGTESVISITAPKTVQENRIKNLSQEDAEQRFSYLASLVDSRGWAIRGTNPQLNQDMVLEAQGTPDLLDETNEVSKTFDTMMTRSTERLHDEAVQRMHQPGVPTPAPITQSVPNDPAAFLQQQNDPQSELKFNPYPTSIQQAVIQPLSDPMHSIAPQNQTHVQPLPQPTQQPAQPTPQPVSQPAPKVPSEKPLSPDIMKLANNTDLSIETIAREAHRIHKKEETEQDMSEEVVISLR